MSHSHSPNPRYESGATHVLRDSEMVVKVTAAMEMNSFTAETTNLINMSTGEDLKSRLQVVRSLKKGMVFI